MEKKKYNIRVYDKNNNLITCKIEELTHEDVINYGYSINKKYTNEVYAMKDNIKTMKFFKRDITWIIEEIKEE